MNNKYRFNYFVYYLLQITWGFFQNILGLFIYIFLYIKNHKRERFMFHGAIVTSWDLKTSCGLGMFIFYGHGNSKNRDKILVHEYGHTLQSVLLGPLFLIVIGIPSLIWAITPYFIKMRKQKKIMYDRFYPESWANGLGEKVLKSPGPDKW